jgi:hypothetical protein
MARRVGRGGGSCCPRPSICLRGRGEESYGENNFMLGSFIIEDIIKYGRQTYIGFPFLSLSSILRKTLRTPS